MTVEYDVEAGELVFTATLLKDSWLSFGFGADMFGTDMLVFLETEKKVLDLWSDGYATPAEDDTQSLTTKVLPTSTDGTTVFETRRKLDTGDPDDFVIQLDKDVVWCWAVRTEDGIWKRHNAKNIFLVRVNSDGTIASQFDKSQGGRDTMGILQLHGRLNFFSWFILGFSSLATKRYL